MNTVLALPAGSNDLAQMDPTERMVMGFLAKYRGATLRAYQQDLKHFLAWCAQVRLNPLAAEEPHLELYVRWMQEQGCWSESTINRRIGTVCGMFKAAKRQRLIEHNPGEFVERPKVDHGKQRCTFLSPLEHAALLKYTAVHGTVMEKAYVAILGLCGLRIAEACSLNVDSYRLDGPYRVLIFIGKGGKARNVRVPLPAMSAIEAAIGDRTEGPILLNRDGHRMNRVNGDAMLKRLTRAAGVNSDVSNHSLRRSLVTTGKASGLGYDELAEILGHASISTTRRYDRHAGSIHRNRVEQIAGYLSDLAS